MIDAFKRASARRDHRGAALLRLRAARTGRCRPRVPITAKLVADLLTAAGVDRVLALDLHAGQIQGFFNIPVDHLFAAPAGDDRLPRQEGPARPGGRLARRRRRGARARHRQAAQRRAWPSSTSAATAPTSRVFMHLIGDVEDKDVVIIDDMIDTAGTLVQAVDALRARGGAAHPRLRRARRAVRAGHRAHQGVAARGGHHHQLDPAAARASSCRSITRSLGRAAARRGDPPHPRRGVGLDPVRVVVSSQGVTVMEMRELTIKRREGTGKQLAKRLRRAGRGARHRLRRRRARDGRGRSQGRAAHASTATRAAPSCSRSRSTATTDSRDGDHPRHAVRSRLREA